MADQVDEIKQKTDIVSLIGEYVQLKKAGRNYKALCPFHSEKSPSFMVSPELQIYKCFGCGESGDALTFLEKYEGMDFSEALKYLADKVGIKLVTLRPGEQGEKERLYEINRLTSRFYHYILVSHPRGKEAYNYLAQDRGLKAQTIETFQIGFSPDVPGVIRKFLVEKKKFQDKELERAGIVVPGRAAIDRFRGRIIFPLSDHRGNIVGFAGRVLPGAKTDLAKYINSPETPIYHKSRILYGLNLAKTRIKEKKTAILVEGELDMISSWQAGIQNTIAIKGSALTDEQVRLMSRFCQKLILALDADFAGDTAARRGIAVAQTHGFEIKVARLEGFKDPDEAARKSPSEYKKALIGAVGVWDFLIDSIFSRFGAKGGEEKAKISREVVPTLAGIPDKIVQAHYIEEVAKRLEVPFQAVEKEVEAYLARKEEGEAKIEIPQVPKEKGIRDVAEARLLTLFFQKDPKGLLEKETLSLIKTSLAKRILEELEAYFKKNPKFNLSSFSKNLPQELSEGFAEIILKEEEINAEKPEQLEREIKSVILKLKLIGNKEMSETLAKQMKELEGKGEKKGLKLAIAKYNKLNKKRNLLEHVKDSGIILQET